MTSQPKNSCKTNRMLIGISILAGLLVFFLLGRPAVLTAAGGLSAATQTPVTLEQLRQIAESRGLRVGVTDGGV